MSGIIKRRNFEEGSEVKEGQSLYDIDPLTYQATYDRDRAALAHDRAALLTAKAKIDRYRPLAAAHAVSLQDLDDAKASYEEALADVQTAKANIGQVSDYILDAEKNNVASVLAVNGFNFAGQAQNAGFFFMSLKDWKARSHAAQSAAAIANRITQHFGNLRDAKVLVVQPPPVLELGNATGFDLELEDRGNLGHDKLLAARNQFLGLAMKDPRLAQVRPNGLEDAPQYKLLVDREKASALGLSIGDINDTIQDSFGSLYVDQFLRQGRVKQVFVQGDAPDRMSLEDLSKWYVRNASSNMVPFSAFLSGEWQIGPQKVEDYNGSTAFEILGTPGPGSSSGQALAAVEDLVKKLPKGITYEWTGLSYEQKKAGSQTLALYGLSFIVILLCLAALYESWAIPFAVILVAPLGILGAVAATLGRGLDDDIYFQVGLLTTVGLSVKNAILIIEFAKGFFEAGESPLDAAIHAARERLRPILMTSIAFACGVFPLAIATGAGASSRIAIGTALVGGVLAATFLAIFFVPFFFVVTLKIFRVQPARKPNDADSGQPTPVAGVP